MKKLLMVLLILGIVLISGCTGQNGGGGKVSKATTGVVISSFSPSIDKVDPEIPIPLPIVIKNTGEYDAKNVEIELMGLPEGSGGWIITPQRKFTVATLSKADSARNIPGGEETQIWEITGPKKSTEISWSMEAKVSYEYGTVSESTIRVVSPKYYTEKKSTGGLLNSGYTGGPLVVNVRVPSAIMRDGDVSVIYEIQNTGGGIPSIGSTGDSNKVSVKVTGVSCGNIADGGSGQISLAGGKTGMITCKFHVSSLDSGFIDHSAKLEFNYNYYVSSTSQITILPTMT